jgi:2-succinyl-6-hydroxy-2,4-cyclohexadiene-1-carboxylate synthase
MARRALKPNENTLNILQMPPRSTIVFLHGFLGSHQDFTPLISSLPDHYNHLALDLPGHGQNLHLPIDYYTFHHAAEFVLTAIQSIAPPIFLYGYSMGGRLALYLALRSADRFAAAFLESTSPGLELPSEQLARLEQDELLAQRIESDFPTFLDRWYQTDLFRSLTLHPSFPALLDRRLHNNPVKLARSLRGMGTGSQPSLWSELPQAKVSLHLIVGTLDPKFCAINQKMLERCPTAQLHRIPSAGHNLHIEAPDRILDLLQTQIPA